MSMGGKKQAEIGSGFLILVLLFFLGTATCTTVSAQDNAFNSPRVANIACGLLLPFTFAEDLAQAIIQKIVPVNYFFSNSLLKKDYVNPPRPEEMGTSLALHPNELNRMADYFSELHTSSFNSNPHILPSSETNYTQAWSNEISIPTGGINEANNIAFDEESKKKIGAVLLEDNLPNDTEITENEYSYKNRQFLSASQIIINERRDQINEAVSNDIWINKTAEKTSYGRTENVTYTIKYGNKGGRADKVVIVDILPDVEIISVEPSATSLIGNNLTWDIGTLDRGQSGLITLVVQQTDIPNLDFKEDSSVSGDGFVNIRKSISTIKENDSLTNTVIISGIYEDGLSKTSSSVTVKIGVRPEANIKNLEHGSGYYEESQISNLNNTITSIKLKKELSAKHRPVELSLPRNRVLKLSSAWSDRTSASTNENGTVNSAVDENRYMDTINKDTSYNIRNREIIYSAQGNFSGGIAQIGYIKRAAGSKKNSAYISETYHGSFRTEQFLDSYGTSPTYKKESSGIGFVSSQKLVGCNQRSYEQGSGSYESAESIQGGTIQKNITLVYMPNNQLAGASKIRYASKWGEAMYTRDAEKGSEILNRISSADYVQMDALMSSSFLSMTGGFNGTNYLKAREIADVKKSTGESFRLEQVLTGSFRLDTTIGLAQALKYTYPHINLTKRVLNQDENIFTYRIWVNNDGNKTLGPVVVVDLMPVEATFISSTLKPSLQGRIVSWTLQALPPGETTIIDLKVSLANISPAVINRVQAVARYQNRTIISEAASSPYDTLDTQEITNESIELEEATTYGEWRPPSCYYLNSSMTGCEKEIEDYYNNLTENCADIP